MNYHQYHPIDVVNGPGTRCTLFVSGCVHQCRGCYNQSTQRLDSGHLFTQELQDHIIADLNDPRIKRRGLSLSGGDPLHPANVSEVLKLVQRVKAECEGKDIWMWTGYELDKLDEKNWGNWQYIAGVGVDPRGGRHFNLQKQTQQYDPHGEYISATNKHPDNATFEASKCRTNFS